MSDPMLAGPLWWVAIKLIGSFVIAVLFSGLVFYGLCWIDYKFLIPMRIRELEKEQRCREYRMR